MSKPLLHIGYHKTGSTYLQKHLFSSKDAGFLALPPASQTSKRIVAAAGGFDPNSLNEWLAPYLQDAECEGLVPVLSNERLSGAPHRGGVDSEIVADRLYSAFGDARILILFREQQRMLLSLYKQYVMKGGVASFSEYVSAPGMFRFDYLEYHRLISHYQKLFGSDNVLALPAEMLSGQPRVFLQHLSAFLGLKKQTIPQQKRANTSSSALAMSVKRHANKLFVPDTSNPNPPLAFEGSQQRMRHITRTISRHAPKKLREFEEKRWAEFAQDHIHDRYRESNAKTQDLSRIEISRYGYQLPA